MKSNRLIAAVLLISSSLSAQADTWQDGCASISQLAATVMDARQFGVAMADLIALKHGPTIQPIVQTMIIQAFEQPRYSTANYQARASQEFRDHWYLACAKVFQD